MKHSILLSFIVLFFAASCTDKEAFKVTGTFAGDDFNGKTVYLIDFNQEKIDSAKVENKQFKLKGSTVDITDVCFIQYSEQYRPVVFFPEPGSIEATIDSSFTPHIKGTTLNDSYQNFTDEVYKMIDSSMQLAETLNKDMEEGKITEQDFKNKQDEFLNEFRGKIYGFVKQNIQNPVGEFLFLDNYNYLSAEQSLELIPMMNPEFKSKESVQRAEKMAQAEAASGIGKSFIDVKGKSLDGKEVSLSDYAGKGKIVLIDFWASWCGPCIKTLPELVTTYQKYKNKGFEIVGISLDDDQQKWADATAKHKITWPQLSNLQGWTDEASQAYGINSIPSTILLDENGVIIEKNMDAKALDQKLAELLK